MTAAAPSVTLDDLPRFSYAELAKQRDEKSGNLIAAYRDLWRSDPRVARLLDRLPAHPVDLEHALIKQAVERATREAKERPPAPAVESASPVDDYMAQRLEVAHETIEACDRRIEQLRVEARAIADKIVRFQHQKRTEAEVGSIRADAQAKQAALAAAIEEAEAARRALVVLERRAADPVRKQQIGELQGHMAAASLPTFFEAVAPQLERLRVIGSELEQIRRVVVDAAAVGQGHAFAAVQLADELEVPRPKMSSPEIHDVRIRFRRALCEGIIAAGGHQREFEELTNVHHVL